ncbi:putative mitochondrial protein [Cucumis melo var. makuwa]|uniref:Mitochondrial protein n=1 Tax=Cucumis melo var. makuwa TaxID=1194695 RepID=A0A5D3BTG9_CUCMM|nr:putative mitochondrial protein [Cucumis melo var. makuwa]TYK02767.1 putative mitochondrial protein [Cucumis melo var. makuwa]
MVMEMINVVVNDFKSTYKRTDEDDDPAPTMTMVPDTMIVDMSKVDTAIEPISVDAALKDEYWINATQEELLQFKRNNVWTLVPKPKGANIIGIKWIFKHKTDEVGYVTRNKAQLVAQGYV